MMQSSLYSALLRAAGLPSDVREVHPVILPPPSGTSVPMNGQKGVLVFVHVSVKEWGRLLSLGLIPVVEERVGEPNTVIISTTVSENTHVVFMPGGIENE